MTRRIVSVWLPHWPITRLSRNKPVSLDRPLVTIEAIRGVRHLVAVGEAGEAHGLAPSQTLTAARAICPVSASRTYRLRSPQPVRCSAT